MSGTASSAAPSFFSRVIGNDALRRGVAGAIAGVLVAVVAESLWPTSH